MPNKTVEKEKIRLLALNIAEHVIYCVNGKCPICGNRVTYGTEENIDFRKCEKGCYEVRYNKLYETHIVLMFDTVIASYGAEDTCKFRPSCFLTIMKEILYWKENERYVLYKIGGLPHYPEEESSI
jgi:hypothetical protein